MNGYELKMHGSIMVKKAEAETVKNILGPFFVRYVPNDNLIEIRADQLDAREYERKFMNLYRQLTPHIISANLYFIDYDSDRWNVSCKKGVWKSTPMRLVYDYDRTTVLDVSNPEATMPKFHNPINYHYNGILNNCYLTLEEENYDGLCIEGSCYILAGTWRHNGINCDIYVRAEFLLDGNGNKDITPFIEGKPYFQVKYSYISDSKLVTGWLDQGAHENFSYPDSSLDVLEKDWTSLCSHPTFDSQISDITDFFKRNNTLIIDAVIEEIEKNYPKEYQEYMQYLEEKNQEDER